MSRSSKWSIWLSILALVAALGSLVVAIIQTGIAKEQSALAVHQTKEDILLQVSHHHGDYPVEIMKSHWLDHPAFVPVRWRAMLVNNGSIPVVLTKYRITQISRRFPIYFSGIDSGVSENGETALGFPMTLKPGDTKQFAISVGVLLNSDVYNKLKDRFPVGTKTRIRQVKHHLWKQGVGLYGNHVVYQEYPEGGVSMMPDITDTEREQVFLVQFATSRSSNISSVFSLYSPFGIGVLPGTR